MALRNIIKEGDETLEKRAREVKIINDRVKGIVEDMLETMKAHNGLGLAANQVGILKRIVVIDVGEGPVILINPKITSKEGVQKAAESCLSIPGVSGITKRPRKVVVEAINLEGQTIEVTGQGLSARALCHEIDHLDGKLFRHVVVEYCDVSSKE